MSRYEPCMCGDHECRRCFPCASEESYPVRPCKRCHEPHSEPSSWCAECEQLLEDEAVTYAENRTEGYVA